MRKVGAASIVLVALVANQLVGQSRAANQQRVQRVDRSGPGRAVATVSLRLAVVSGRFLPFADSRERVWNRKERGAGFRAFFMGQSQEWRQECARPRNRSGFERDGCLSWQGPRQGSTTEGELLQFLLQRRVGLLGAGQVAGCEILADLVEVLENRIWVG